MNGSSLPSRTVTIASSSSANPSATLPDIVSARPSPFTPSATRPGSFSRLPRSRIWRATSSATVGWPAIRLASIPVNDSRSPWTRHSGTPSSRRPERLNQPMPCGWSPLAMWKTPMRNATAAASTGRESDRKASHAATLSLRQSSMRPSHHTASAYCGEVIGGESIRRDSTECVRRGTPVLCSVGPPCPVLGVLVLIHRYSPRSKNSDATSSPRLATPTLAKMWRRCSWTVYGETRSRRAIR